MTPDRPPSPASGRLFLILGPSGVGKSTAIRCLRERIRALRYPLSYTTRPPRSGELDGVDYHFVSEEQFLRLRGHGELLEWDQPHGTYYYGIPRAPVLTALAQGEILIREIAVHGLEQLQAGPAAPWLYSVFLMPAATGDLAARLANRGGDNDTGRRIRRAELEISTRLQCDQILEVIHGEPDAVCDVLEQVIRQQAGFSSEV